jgi:hypothetical protein
MKGIRAATSAIACLSLTAAAPFIALPTRVNAICVVVGTRIAMHYKGTLSDHVEASGVVRTMGSLTAASGTTAKSIEDYAATLKSDIEKYGAPHLQAPTRVTLFTVEWRGGGSWTGLGSGDVNTPAETPFQLQMACDVFAALEDK